MCCVDIIIVFTEAQRDPLMMKYEVWKSLVWKKLKGATAMSNKKECESVSFFGIYIDSYLWLY